MTTSAAKAVKTKAEADRKYSLDRATALAKADSDFQAAVEKASDTRQKALDKYPDKGNLAERAWNETKDDADPVYRDVASPFRSRLDSTAETIRATGRAGEVGLEAFEEEVLRLIKAEEVPTGPVLALVTAGDVEAAEATAKAKVATKKAAKAKKVGK